MGTNASVSSTKDRTIRTTVSQHKPRQPTKEKMKSTALAVGLAVGLAVATVSTCQAEKEETYLEAATHFCETMTTNNKQCGWVGMDDPRYQNDREVKINQIGCPSAAPCGEAGTKRMKRERGALSNIPRTPSSAQGLMEQATSRTFLGTSRLVAEGRRSRCKRSTNLSILSSTPRRLVQDPTMLGSTSPWVARGTHRISRGAHSTRVLHQAIY